jgi:hypothetical protein
MSNDITTKFYSDPTSMEALTRRQQEDKLRWGNLWDHYSERIGPEGMKEESVRVRVTALVTATLELERLTEGIVAGTEGRLLRKSNHDNSGHPHDFHYAYGNPVLLATLTATIMRLLKSLWLNQAPYGQPAKSGHFKAVPAWADKFARATTVLTEDEFNKRWYPDGNKNPNNGGNK